MIQSPIQNIFNQDIAPYLQRTMSYEDVFFLVTQKKRFVKVVMSATKRGVTKGAKTTIDMNELGKLINLRQTDQISKMLRQKTELLVAKVEKRGWLK